MSSEEVEVELKRMLKIPTNMQGQLLFIQTRLLLEIRDLLGEIRLHTRCDHEFNLLHGSEKIAICCYCGERRPVKEEP